MVLTFLRDTRVGEFVSLEALGGGCGLEEAEPVAAEEDGFPLRTLFSFVLSVVLFLFSFVFFGEHGVRRLESPTMTAGFCAARGLRSGSPVGDGIWSC